jgi:DNA ligase D-like protein (predicted 3'-phosphoesterase)
MASKKQADGLELYRSKRDFRRSPEPSGKGDSRWRKDGNPIFVIQKHDASRLHYDFRLEIDGVLKSWAVPKGPSTDPRQKRLAVHVEDHPLDYADFEGVIPQDEYGGGTVLVWDAGPFRNLKHDRDGQEIPIEEAYRRGQIEIWLEGRKLHGGYALVHSKLGGQDKNWLLIKMKDEGADARRDPVSTEPRSVLSGRTIEEIAAQSA